MFDLPREVRRVRADLVDDVESIFRAGDFCVSDGKAGEIRSRVEDG
jgi:hypothetical protein